MNVQRFSNDAGDLVKAYYNNSGDRLGFAAKEGRDDGTRYGIGIDNMGSIYRGALDRELNTPLGIADYGYDGDTIYAGFTPNANVQQAINKIPNPYYIQALANMLGNMR